MKQSPDREQAQRRMQPGVITRDGFLGADARSLTEIENDDEYAVRRLGLTHEEIADRLADFTERGKAGLGTTVVVEDRYEVRVEDVRGMLPCPYGHRGMYPKRNTYLKDLVTGKEMVWTALTEHLIREHGFYEGRGSVFRVSPVKAKNVLGL